jgi:hypothetical protein
MFYIERKSTPSGRRGRCAAASPVFASGIMFEHIGHADGAVARVMIERLDRQAMRLVAELYWRADICLAAILSMGAAGTRRSSDSDGGTAKPTGSWPFAQVSHIWISALS